MNKEDQFRKKITKIVMFALAIGILALIVSGVVYFMEFPTKISDSLTPTEKLAGQIAHKPMDIFSVLINSVISIVSFAGLVIGVTLFTLLATKFHVLLRWMAAPVVWVIVIFMRRIGWFEGPRAAASIEKPYSAVISGLLTISRFLFSKKTYEEVFDPIIGDLNHECFEAVKAADIDEENRVKIYYAYHILATMVEKSPIGDLIEFIRKIAK